MARLRNFWRRFADWLIIPSTVAALLLVLGALIVAGGYLYHHCECQSWPNFVAGWEPEFEALYANFATTLIGIAVAVFTIDRANERRAKQEAIERERLAEQQARQQLKAQLIREMGSTDNGIALRAVRELRAHGWLEDGSLQRAELRGANLQGASLVQGAELDKADLEGAYLYGAKLNGANLQGANLHRAGLSGANLQEAFLIEANLQGANLFWANLDGASLSGANLHAANLERASLHRASLHAANLEGARELTDQQLVTAACLGGATMRDGSRYDGRFNLSGDTELLQLQDVSDETMAGIYGVPLETYLAGQEWARENLSRLRREAG